MSENKARFLQGAGLVLAAAVVALAMRLLAGATPVLAGEPRLVASDWTLQGDETVPGLRLEAGTLDLNGHTLTVAGDLIQAGGTLYVHGGTLRVAGDYRLQAESGGEYADSGGILRMTHGADRVVVEGAFAMQSTVNHGGRLTAGVLEVKGNFAILPGGAYNFAASGAHKVVLSGDGVQTVRLGLSQCFLNLLEIKKTVPDGLRFEGRLIANNLICHGYTLPALEVAPIHWVLDEDLAIEGQLTLAGGVLDLAGRKLTVRGRLLQPGGAVYPGGGRLHVTGDYRLQAESGGTYAAGSGILAMAEPGDHIRVDGDFVTQSAIPHLGLLSAGALEVKGEFTQLGGSAYNFRALGSHKTILSGPGVQAVKFANPSSSRFRNLVITKPLATGYEFLSPTPCWDKLIEEWADTTPPSAPANLAVTGVTTDSVSLVWNAATDDILVAGYEIYRNGALCGATDMPRHTDTGLAPGTTYHYYVRAYDTRMNYSAGSDTVTAVTESGGMDTIPPITAHDYQYDGRWVNAPAEIRLTAADEGGSGVKATYYQVSGGPVQTGNIVSLAEDGEHAVAFWSEDNAGNIETPPKTVTVMIDRVPPEVVNLTPADGHWINTPRPIVTATFDDALSGADPASLALILDGVQVTDGIQVQADGFQYIPEADLSAGTHSVRVSIRDRAGNQSAESYAQFRLDPGMPAIPPDPATIAPPLDMTVFTDLASATAFLYSGANPIQTGVAPGTIEPVRAAVLRGRVLTREGSPLPGVTLTVHGHPEFGRTVSRQDGCFDLAVNGGGPLTVTYTRPGYLPAQRQVNVPWRDYTWLPDVVLIQLDEQVTAVDLDTPGGQVARGSVVTDQDGTRQAAIYFPEGTRALGLGTAIHVRATEFTVGDNGPKAMPAELPPQVGYTYCVELSVDEALGESVQFDRPVSFYVENFLGFPVGGLVPVGYYDYDKALWIPSDNGRVIGILGADPEGLAELDVDGSGAPADAEALADLGIDSAERRHLASLYQPGQSIWRVRVTHFWPWDCNWPYGPPPGAEAPQQGTCETDTTMDQPSIDCGSIVEVQNQILGESIGLTGTPFTLNYASDRMPGRVAANTLDVSLSGETLPPGVKTIELVVEIAGQRFERSFPAQTGLGCRYTWDGKNIYGQSLQGKQPVSVRIGYTYDAVYMEPAELARSFGAVSGLMTGVRARNEVTLWQGQKTTLTNQVSVGAWDVQHQGLGGWTISAHHAYDPHGGILHLGDGTRRSADNILSIDLLTPGNRPVWPEFVQTSVPPDLGWAIAVAAAPDGSLYVVDEADSVIRRIAPDGTITVVAWNHEGDDMETGIYPTGVAISPDGSIYIIDGHCISRLGPDGAVTIVAGTGSPGYSGDGGPADQAELRPSGVAVGPDGSIYIAEMDNHCIRRVGPDGIITTIAGTGNPGHSGDGGPAGLAELSGPWGMAFGPDGSLYIADLFANRVRRIGPDGIITTAAGTGVEGGAGDGGPAVAAELDYPSGVAVGLDGSLYILERAEGRVRMVGTDGVITTIAGGGEGLESLPGPARQIYLFNLRSIAVGPDGAVYFVNGDVYKLAPTLPCFGLDDIIIPSADGGEIYRFNSSGRHLNTYNATTNSVVYTFLYDQQGYLVRIEDADGNQTAIERDAAGNPVAVVAPFGQRTTLSLNAEGYLDRITNPAGESYRFAYAHGGLLTELRDPRNNLHRFTYDELGRLIREEDPAGGFTMLSRTDDESGLCYTITKTEGVDAETVRVTTYRVENLPGGERRTVSVGCCGEPTTTVAYPDGRTVVTNPDGTVVETVQIGDPRFGMQAPLTKCLTMTTPGGLAYVQYNSREVELADPADPFSLVTLTDTVSINGRVYVSVYDAATRTIASTTPEGRQSFTTLDEKGRVVLVENARLGAGGLYLRCQGAPGSS